MVRSSFKSWIEKKLRSSFVELSSRTDKKSNSGRNTFSWPSCDSLSSISSRVSTYEELSLIDSSFESSSLISGWYGSDASRCAMLRMFLEKVDFGATIVSIRETRTNRTMSSCGALASSEIILVEYKSAFLSM
ncbi:hypothetical protein OGATHE_006438 [Ogataea polymorpha]|uniref:Uncharacterized protein n=1 Tax=Ogataea polymorpha TaxID=460523 RepID=A0A9P8SXY9_9ASCO|nr:hypothetical protein OGATHE_006438 [Ogataea polymorpha]